MSFEAELRGFEQRLQHIAFSTPPAIVFTMRIEDERVACITWISKSFEQLLGYSVSEALGPDWWRTHVHPDDRDALDGRIAAELISTGQAALEFRFQHAQGHYRWTSSRLAIVRNEAGQPLEAVGLSIDITDRKEAEAEQAKLRDQLLQAQRMESVARLAGGAAHDLNNLLTVINGYSDLVLARLTPEEPLWDSVAEIRRAGERAADLSRQLVILSRKQIVQPALINLNEVIGEVGKTLRRLIGEDVQLKSRLNPALFPVLADSGQVQQVLMNLAVNARDAMPNGGTLFVETDNVVLDKDYAREHIEVQPGEYVQLKVSDTGTGMTKEVLAHIFEPFFTTKGPAKGTGLGLATVYSIVKQCGGSITVYSELGHGSVFTVYLPKSERSVAALQEPRPAHVVSVRGTETILVVEDQEQVRRMVTTVLRENGYRVLEGSDPEDGLRQSEGHAGEIHLLLTDVIMPGMSGRDLADRILVSRPSIEVIYMSAYSEPMIHERGILAQSANFLAKPFPPERLLIQVREVLGPPRPAGRALIVDDEAGIRNFLRKSLTGAGYDVVEARHRRDAEKLLAENQVDLAITDLIMPQQEGIETVQTIRRHYPGVRIIAMTGAGSQDPLRASGHLAADAAIERPFTPEELLTVVDRVMGKYE